MLDFYEEYFNIRYPLPKQGYINFLSYVLCLVFTLYSSLLFHPLADLIAIPDFQVGAMENWGLTTYRETSLLYEPLTSSISDKLWVTMVIAHELAHQVKKKVQLNKAFRSLSHNSTLNALDLDKDLELKFFCLHCSGLGTW